MREEHRCRTGADRIRTRPAAVSALTKIFFAEIERLLCVAAGVTIDADALPATHPRLGAVSFLHRFGSALNHHVHLHVCASDGVFVPTGDGPPAFLPARPLMQADLATLTERVRCRMNRWFRLTHVLDASASADMPAWENSGFSIDASVRIAMIPRWSWRVRYDRLARGSRDRRAALHHLAHPGVDGLRLESIGVVL